MGTRKFQFRYRSPITRLKNDEEIRRICKLYCVQMTQTRVDSLYTLLCYQLVDDATPVMKANKIISPLFNGVEAHLLEPISVRYRNSSRKMRWLFCQIPKLMRTSPITIYNVSVMGLLELWEKLRKLFQILCFHVPCSAHWYLYNCFHICITKRYRHSTPYWPGFFANHTVQLLNKEINLSRMVECNRC